jgi:RNA-directed DNA polymerase
MIGKWAALRVNIKPSKQLWLPFELKGEVFASREETAFPAGDMQHMERILERGNLRKALQKVVRNGGSPGINGMTVKDLTPYLKREWPKIRGQLLNGDYVPSPVKRVEIPKPGGGIRQLGIPTVLDRFIQQAMLQELQREWDGSFSEFSYGFRPKRSAHQAIEQAQEYLKEGYSWVVDLDLEKFFDRVNQDKLMSEVGKRVADPRVKLLILRFLRSGVSYHDKLTETKEGTPQGGPLTPRTQKITLSLSV